MLYKVRIKEGAWWGEPKWKIAPREYIGKKDGQWCEVWVRMRDWDNPKELSRHCRTIYIKIDDPSIIHINVGYENEEAIVDGLEYIEFLGKLSEEEMAEY